MKLWVGTSGYSYKEWKGGFYPENLPDKDMLKTYARKLPAVEINNTFYRLPTPLLLGSWAEQVPGNFRFVLKASGGFGFHRFLGLPEAEKAGVWRKRAERLGEERQETEMG